MTTKKKIILSIGSSFLLIPLLTFSLNHELTSKNLSDNFFMLSLVFLIIGGFILVLSSGFFDLFQKNMKHLFNLRKNETPKEYVTLSDIFKKKPIYWFSVGLTMLLISIILALLS